MGWLMCKSETVILIDKVETGKDPFNVPIYDEIEIEVKNVLVKIIESSASMDVLDTVNLTGKKAIYELCIPKGDENEWDNRDVIIRGHRFRTVGFVREWVNPPLDWNRRIMVERYE